MYFPILRAKRYEMEALVEAAPAIIHSGKIFPIIEPVNRDIRPVIQKLQSLRSLRVPVIVVLNPARGELARDVSTVANALNASGLSADPGVTIAIHLHENAQLASIQHLVQDPANHPLVIIHRNPRRRAPTPLPLPAGQVLYRVVDNAIPVPTRPALGAGTLIELHHCFQRRNNADYSADEFFTDPQRNLIQPGIRGFSDFTVVGDIDPRGGGAAHAVALHLTYQTPAGAIRIRHFVSDDVIGTRNPGGKFVQALAKLVAFTQQNPMPYSTAVPEFLALYSPRPHYPGLGIVKKLSIRHHLELMAYVL
jgi:hypothetical protein